MSVLEANRRESDMEFLKNARDIEELFIDLRISKPKRYTFFFDKLLDYSFDLIAEVKAANSIYPENKDEVGLRQRHFKEALAKCQVLVSQVEVIRHKLKDDGITIGQVQETSKMISDEIRLIKGVIKKDKERYKNILEKD